MSVEKRISVNMVRRALVLLIAFAVFALFLMFVLFDLQVLKYEYYQGTVLDQLTYETEINPERGDIYDINGNILATNTEVWLVFISPQDIIDAMAEKEKESIYTWSSTDLTVSDSRMDVFISKALSEILGVDYDYIYERTTWEGYRYAVIAKNVESSKADEIRKLINDNKLISQIYIRASAARTYPYGSLAAHVLGFTNSDGVGIYGIESMYNNVLEGTSGRYITAQDAHNNPMPFEYETYVEAENGYNINSTIDMYIQYELENQLEATLLESGANNRVAGAVIDVETGAILAMAVAPTFDLNSPYTLDDLSLASLSALGLDPNSAEYNEAYYNLVYSMWNNKAITELYEPGSTFKIMTSAMAFEEDLVKVTDEFYCSGALKIEGYSEPIKCHRVVGHGHVNFAEGLQQSCNPTLMTIAARLGTGLFYNYFEAFGYTGRTGIDLPGEVYGIFHPRSGFGPVELAVYSFGQTFKTTLIQQLTAISAVANGGYLVTPHVVSQIVDGDGNVIESYDTEIKRQIISEETCDILTQILEEGVSGNGGAKNAYVKGYKVAAKTGTSQKQDKYAEDGTRPYRVGSCVAYAPADDPKIAAIIVVDEPSNGSVFGSVVAAPYVSNLMGFILPYLGYEPTYTADELQNIEVSVSNYIGCTVDTVNSDLGWRGINYKIIGDGDTVTAQVPKGGSSFNKEKGQLLLYTGDSAPVEDITVPDVVGNSAETANRKLVNLGLNIKIEGAQNYDTGTGAVVISQSPEAGTVVSRGTVVTIEFRHMDGTD